jgi:hypothetical protein
LEEYEKLYGIASPQSDEEAHKVGVVNKSRWRDFGTLKYAMRSIFINAPWVRHIFIVVDQNKTTSQVFFFFFFFQTQRK